MNGTKTEIKPGRWRLRVYVGRTEAGTPRQVSRNFAGSAREADKALRAFIRDVETGRFLDSNPTVAHVLSTWMAHRRKATPLTLQADQGYIDRRIVPALGDIRLDRLTGRHLDRAYTAWLEEGLAPATVQKMHAIISAALSQAVKWEWTDRNVTKLATPPTRGRAPDRSIAPAELTALIQAARDTNPTLAMAISLGAVTGARRGELCALRWSDLDRTGSTLTIARSVSTLPGGELRAGPTKNHQTRRIIVDTGTVALLDWWTEQQAAFAARVGVRLDPDPHILAAGDRPRGDYPLRPVTLSHWFTDLNRNLGLPYHFHELRHFAATRMIAAGVDPRMAATRLGHARPDITLNIYAHAVAAADQRAADLLGAALPALPT